MIWYYIIFYYSILPTHKRLHSTIGCIFPSVGASRGVLARHGALDASFWRSVPLCRELQLARYKKSLQDGVDGVQRSKDGIWWHMMAWCWGVTSPCLGHSFARGSMQTSMLIPRRPVFLFFQGTCLTCAWNHVISQKKTEINTSRLFLGSFVHMVSHGPIVDCDLWGDGVPAAPHISLEVDGCWSYCCVFLFCVR